MSYESTLAYIHHVQWRGQKPGLERTQALLAHLGHPEEQLKFVHIGGTNGKGSTAAMTASVLRAAGYRVGLYTSPYLNRFNERIQINGAEIPDEALESIVDELRPFADAMEDLPSEFELITAIAMAWFARQCCDIVVLEVGLGGEFDATNVIPCPEVAVLTAIGLDHTGVLGSTVAEIARTKSGIIKEGGSVVSFGQLPEADAEIEAACRARHARLFPVDFSRLEVKGLSLEGCTFDFQNLTGLHIPLLGAYQPKNAAVAVTALTVLAAKGWNITEEHIRAGLARVEWPGRFELLGRHPVFLLDGSHNPHGMAATVEGLKALFPGEKFVFLLSIMADKAVDEMLRLLLPLAERFFTVTADNPRAMPGEELAERIREMGAPAEFCADIPQAVAAAQEAAGCQGRVCALGTLYFSGEVRRAYQAQSTQ